MNNHFASKELMQKEVARLQQEQKRHFRRMVSVFGSADGQKILKHYEEVFGVDLPVFREEGKFDVMQAATNDAYRRLFRMIRDDLQKAMKLTTKDNDNE